MMTLPFTPTTSGTEYITGIAIDPHGNTSEFSPCRDLLRASLSQGTDPTYGPYPGSIAVYFWPHLGANPAHTRAGGRDLRRRSLQLDADNHCSPNWYALCSSNGPGLGAAHCHLRQPSGGGIPDPFVSLTSNYEVTSDADPGVTIPITNPEFDEYRFYWNEYATPHGGAALALPNYYVTFNPATGVGTFNGSFAASNALEFANAHNYARRIRPGRIV